MDAPDPLNDQLNDLADTIATGDPEMSLDSVRATVARRRRRRNVIGGAMAAAALVGGVLVVGGVTGNDGSDSIAIDGANADTPTTDEPADAAGGAADGDGTDQAPAATASSDDVPDLAPPIAATVVERISADAIPVSIGVDDEGAGSPLEWIVPWQDGFLAGRTIYTPQPLPTELPEEITALFSPEVLELFADGLPPTVDEATAMLSEAGLLDEVSSVLADNPEANDAVFSSQPSQPEATVMFSIDGIEWEPIDFVTPDGAFGLYGIQSTGSRLAVATQTFDESLEGVGGESNDIVGEIVVRTTTDLINWDAITVDVESRPVDLPDVINYQVSPNTLAINDGGWVLPTNTYTDIDVIAVLPDDLRERVQNGSSGYGTSYDHAGITVEIYGDSPAETVPEDTTASESGDEVEFLEPDVIEEITLTWEELGLDAADVDALDQRPESQVFAAEWGGVPQLVDGVGGWSVVAGGDGFYAPGGATLRHSTDGLVWTSLTLPVEDASVGTVKSLPDAALVVVAGDDGASQVFRVTGSDDVWELLDIPGAPPAMFDVFGYGSSASAMLVDGNEPVVVEPTEITVESDGFTMVLGQDRSSTSITVTDASGALVVEETHDWNSGDDPATWRYARSGIDVIDPDTGDVVVSFDNDVLEVAYREQTDRDEQYSEFDPDLWLVATTTGDRWLIEDLDVDFEFEGGEPGSLALNGDTLVVHVGGSWLRYDLS